MLPLGRFRADGDAHHPAAIENGGGEIGPPGSIDSFGPCQRVPVECFAFLPTRVRLDLMGWGEDDIFAHG